MSIRKHKTLMSFIIFVLISLFPQIASAYKITDYLEMVIVDDVDNTNWQELSLENTYNNPVVVCTYNLPSSSDNEGYTRVRVNGTGTNTNIEVTVLNPDNDSIVASEVYCTISETGSYKVTDGDPITYTALIVESNTTNYKGNWGSMTSITNAEALTYSNPVILGQIMSNTNSAFVTFWSSNCSQTNSATQGSLCVSKHTGESYLNHGTETLGVIIAEKGEYTASNVAYIEIALGSDSIEGVGSETPSPSYDYSLSTSHSSIYTYGTATLSAMDGGDGGWAVFYGNDPVSTTLNLAIDEDTVQNTERNHTPEQVAYWVMEPIPHPEISLKKTVLTIYDPVNLTSNPKSIPGAILEYTLVGENSGNGPADINTIVLTDLVPDNTTLCVVTASNCEAPSFIPSDSGLTIPTMTYSDDTGATIAYDYDPIPNADTEGSNALVTHLKAAMGGSFLAQTGTTAPSFTFKFRVTVE